MGMVMQTQSTCKTCRGTGEYINPADRCKTCDGQGTVKQNHILDVKIEKGNLQGELVFKGEGNQAPNAASGDVIIQLELKPHPYFELRGRDLVYKKKLTLLESLTGFQFPIRHLDSREFIVKNNPSSTIIKPGDIKKIKKRRNASRSLR